MLQFTGLRSVVADLLGWLERPGGGAIRVAQPPGRVRVADAPLRASEVPTAGKIAEPTPVVPAAPIAEAVRPRGWLARSGGWLR